MNLRPITDGDDETIAAIMNTADPERHITANDLREDGRTRDPKFTFECWLAEDDGQIIGMGAFGHSRDMYHPQKFWLNVEVFPEVLGKGVGKALYEHLLVRLEPHQPLSLIAWARAGETRRTRFWEARGFHEIARSFTSSLAVASFDFTPFAGLEVGLEREGITFAATSELSSDPNYPRKIYELHTELDADVPVPEPYTKPSFENFAARHFEGPITPTFIVALDGGEYVGLGELWPHEREPCLRNGITGVRRAYRRRGIALALKVQGVRFAEAHGYAQIRTENAAENAGMLRVNEQLGFARRPANITYRKSLRP